MEIFYSNLIEGGSLTLVGDEAMHCSKVLRHRPGDEIGVIDGQGTLYKCVLTVSDSRECLARIVEAVPGFGSHPYKLTMAVCPTKNIDRYEWFAEKATEIGVDAIVPVIGDRSERKVLKTDRLRRLVLSAAKQSLKGAVPQVLEPVSVKDFLESVPEEAVKLICYCFDDGEKHTGAEVLRDSWPALGMTEEGDGGFRGKPGMTKPIYILIGPEGDFSPAEAALARSLGWIPVTLGPSRLRTETAAMVAAAQGYSVFLATLL